MTLRKTHNIEITAAKSGFIRHYTLNGSWPS